MYLSFILVELVAEKLKT